jgi:hypothetical protein
MYPTFDSRRIRLVVAGTLRPGRIFRARAGSTNITQGDDAGR